MNVLLTIAYEGTAYAGWQRQENAVSIQQRVEEGLSALLGRETKLTAASRTDAGVHALGQRASFTAPAMPIPMDKLPQAINGFLPKDIAIQAAEAVADDFNPRFGALAKTYRYQIYNAPYPNPLHSRYSAFVPNKLDTAAMSKAAELFVGRHDFSAFCAAGSSAKTHRRTIFSCEIKEDGPLLSIYVSGDAFLYNMVRIMAGTLLYVGLGKILDIPAIINSQDRTKAGKTMPAEGLCLLEVKYS